MKISREHIVLFFVLAGSLIIASRLFYLQIANGGYYKNLAEDQHNYISEEEGERGEIYFSGGEILAMTEKSAFLFISPEEIEEKEETSQLLSDILDIDKDVIFEKASKEGSYYEILKENLLEEEIESLEDMTLSGVYIRWTPYRYYPLSETASQIVGFLNQDGEGQYGLEEYYDEILKGSEGIYEEESNPWGFLFSSNNTDLDNGSSLYLTIDYNIQFMTEKILREGIEEYGAEGGQIVVLNPESAKVIAMADYPGYNPNNYQDVEEYSVFQNGSTQRLFEPGSIFKPITMAAALNEEAVTPDTEYVDDLGYAQIGGYKVYNYSEKAWGKRTMTQVLEGSINTGVIFAEKLLGHQNFYDYLEKFGFFEKTGIDLAGEAYPRNFELEKALENDIEVDFATASFGQGIETTPLQMATAYCALANGGTLYKPYAVEKIENSQEEKEIEPQVSKENVISQYTSIKLTQMLISVVENGFGHLAQIPGYFVAGKTGTSQVAWASLGVNQSGYSSNTWQTFAGYAPALNPAFVIVVKLDNPKTKTSEYSAVPMFHDLAKYILDYWQIPPDYDVEEDLDKE